MTGSLLAPLPLSSPAPVRPVARNYSVDSFSEYSTRIVNHETCSPTSPTSGSRSARPKEEDEELFRDLFAGENDAEADDDSFKPAAPTFLPQKPTTKRAPSTTNPRQHLAPMRPAPPQPVLTPPFIPRLKFEELVNVRPDDDGGDDDEKDDNISRRASRRGSELEQVMEEDESYTEDGSIEHNDGKVAPRKTQVLNRDRGFNSSTRLASKNQCSNNDENLEQETLRFLEKLDLKSVLYTPRPDLLSFYPNNGATPSTARSQVSPYSQMEKIKHPEDHSVDIHHSELEKARLGFPGERIDDVCKDGAKGPRVGGISSRLAYMESAYGTAPIVRKTRQETINRLANPISGHSSTLQALSPRQREKRQAALTNRAQTSPISTAFSVSCRRGPVTRKGKVASLLVKLEGKTDIPVSAPVASKRNVAIRPDPLIHKRRPINLLADGLSPTVDCRRKSKATMRSRSIVVRKEALKKKLQNRQSTTKRSSERKIGGATFLTQRDDEEGVEMIEDFISRNRGAAQAPLTFRSNRTAAPRQTISALPKKHPTTARSRPRPPQARVGVPFARGSGTTRSTYRGRVTHTSRELESLENLKQKAATFHSSTFRSETEWELRRAPQHPKRPQAWQATSSAVPRNIAGRPTTPGGAAANPLRKLKVHPAMPTLFPRVPKTPPSAASTLLMGSLFSLSGAEPKRYRQSTKEVSERKSDRASRITTTSFDAPTKISAQRRRTSTRAVGNAQQSAPRVSTSRLNCEEKPRAPLLMSGPRHFTSRL